MITNNFYPLRSIVGPSIPIGLIQKIKKKDDPLIVETQPHSDISQIVSNPTLSKFLPDIFMDGILYHPLNGMATMPTPNSNLLNFELIDSQLFEGNPYLSNLNIFRNPPDVPFPETDNLYSLYGYREDGFQKLELNIQASENSEYIKPFYSNRDNEYSFLIFLEKEALVGGICFNGYPYISSRIENTPEGMTVGNFGLPREIRLAPLPMFKGIYTDKMDLSKQFIGFNRSQFIDSEFAYTRQEIISHSGLNYLMIDPVKTNLFMLTITDLPFIPKTIYPGLGQTGSDNSLLIEGFKGFAIPYLYFFEYKEHTKKDARIHTGLLGVKSSYPHLPKVNNDPANEDIIRRAFPEYEYMFIDNSKKENENDSGVSQNYLIKYIDNVIHAFPDREELIITLQKLTEYIYINDVPDEMLAKLESFKDLSPIITQLIELVKKFMGKMTDQNEIREGAYILYSAHSALGQRREFECYFGGIDFPFKGRLPNKKRTATEWFLSDILQPDEKVTLYLQQAEEFERCVAGLKILFMMIPGSEKSERFILDLAEQFLGINTDSIDSIPDWARDWLEKQLAFVYGLPPEVNFCEKIGVKIFEIDPIEGVSPASVDLKSKYANLLVDFILDDIDELILSEMLKGIPFKRTSSSKYFALELTNTSEKNGQVAIHSLQLIRSAHVSVQPRPAKMQQIKAMHYRIIGAELADDFSKLGNEGFNFSIDRVVAGQTKNVLYSAMSLLDLLHTGGAKIHSNLRRRAIEFEKSEIYSPNDNYNFGERNENIEKRTSIGISEGWKSYKTGDGVNGKEGWPDNSVPYESTSNQETRLHTEYLFPNTGHEWVSVKEYMNKILGILASPTTVFKFGTSWVPSGGDLTLDFNFWKGIDVPLINGLRNINASPFSPIVTLGNFIQQGDFDSIPNLLVGMPLMVASGGNSNFGVSVAPLGIGVSTSLGFMPFPSFTHNTTFGSTGNIHKQASKTGYSFSKSLNKSYDDNYIESNSIGGEIKRIVTRKEIPDSDKQRLRGAEVMWQDKIQDIITGTIPLNINLPATASKMNYRTVDETLRVRFNSGFSPSIEVDFWFELTEENIKDDN